MFSDVYRSFQLSLRHKVSTFKNSRLSKKKREKKENKVKSQEVTVSKITENYSPPGREIIFPTAVPDPQYELICIQPIRAT